MSFSPIPDYSFEKLENITPGFLKEKNIDLLMLDLDNTISPYGRHEPGASMIKWAAEMRDAGIELIIVSNNNSCLLYTSP